ATRPYRRIIDDHRKAARSLRRHVRARVRAALLYRATPSPGTRPLTEFEPQQFRVPAAVQGELVIGNRVGPLAPPSIRRPASRAPGLYEAFVPPVPERVRR